MYVVAVNVDHYNRTFSKTCRDLQRSPHWKSKGGDTWTIRDTRELVEKYFVVLFTADTESEARKFSACIEAAYKAQGLKEVLVKAVDTETV